jgi:hypothetical protein
VRTTPALADVPELAHLETVRQRVCQLPDEGQFFRVGICLAGGCLIAAATFTSFDQVWTFASALREFGYRALVSSEEEQMQGCDVIFSKQSFS